MASSPSSSCRREWKYDVFLSFRGEDTRNNFTAHLYKELCRQGIIAFKDDRELTKGEPLPLELPLAIDQSRVLLIIFSKNYAYSRWCLDELVQISKRKETGGRQIVLPIFYDVTPSDVRKKTGDFGLAFAQHKDNIDKVQQWRIAAKQIADLSGWELKNRDESDFIEEIVRYIIHILMSRLSHSIAKDFVGMESRLVNMLWCLELGQTDNVKMVGIWGMGGIGKTTMASVVYKEIYGEFDARCFLTDVRETSKRCGLVYLQKQLLSATLLERNIEVYDIYKGTDEIRHRLNCKKVLVILDDVDHLSQIEALIGGRDEHWFGPGSRIIITTRDEHILIQRGVDEICSVKELNYGEALQLFCSKSIQCNCNEERLELCSQVVKYAGGLPLALTVLGSTLYGRSVREWKSMLDRLKDIPNEEILSKLQISFDGLEEIQKKLFLDIACFFKGKNVDYVKEVLECCGFHPEIGLKELVDKSLIDVSYGDVKMHDLLQQMGQDIVRREFPENPSRIWLFQDAYDFLVNDKGPKGTEGLVLDFHSQEGYELSAKGFSEMKNLRLLILKSIRTFDDVENLSNKLRYLNWDLYPAKTLPSNFKPDGLAQLIMHHSSIEQLWEGLKKPRLKWLKVIDLSYSENLIKTPDFTEMSNLKKLNFEGCLRLHEVHRSIGVLQKLVSLNLRLCRSLVSLPSALCDLKSLKILNLDGCTKLSKLPHKLGDLKSLEELHMAGIGTQQLTITEALSSLLRCWLMPWKNQNQYPLASLLHSLTAFSNLRELDLSNCNLLDKAIPSDLSGKIPMVEILNLSGNNFKSIPSSLNKLSRLIDLRIANCKMLKSLPDLPSSIEHLHMENCTSLEVLPNLLEKSNVEMFVLDFSNCTKLNDYQCEFTILKNYLLCLFRTWQQANKYASYKCWDHEIINWALVFPCPDFRLLLPGTEIPSWFNYQGVGSILRVELPYENCSHILGFVVCILLKREVCLELNELMLWSIKVNGFSMVDFLPLMPSGGIPAATDHLHMFFVTNMLDMEEVCYACIEMEVLLPFDREGIKKCGMHVLHERDMEELIQSGGSLFSGSQNMNQTKRSREQDCSNSATHLRKRLCR